MTTSRKKAMVTVVAVLIFSVLFFLMAVVGVDAAKRIQIKRDQPITIISQEVMDFGRVVNFVTPSGMECVHVQTMPSSPATMYCQ